MSIGSSKSFSSMSESMSGSDSGSFSFFSLASSSSSSGSGGGGSDGGGGGSGSDGGGSTGPGCPAITDIAVTVFSVGYNVPPVLCFDDPAPTQTLCVISVGFNIAPFDADCANHLVANVKLGPGEDRSVAIDSGGGFYQVSWGGSGGGSRKALFPATEYTVEICLERKVGTPMTCEVPEGCCEEIQWTSPPVCECYYEITDAVVTLYNPEYPESGGPGEFTVTNHSATTPIVVTGFVGPGDIVSPSLPYVIAPLGSATFSVIDVFDTASPFFIVTEPCGNSPDEYWTVAP